MQVGEVASPTARHQDFLAYLVRTLKHNNATTTGPSGNCAHEAGRAATQDNYVVVVHGGNIAGALLVHRN